ncbi:hypothetical protein HanIR_Chr16g0793451 [Helianthus annuus]|nr:hypothetical protein HanIR_Chr16g0793451 [Helianthus annuus]
MVTSQGRRPAAPHALGQRMSMFFFFSNRYCDIFNGAIKRLALTYCPFSFGNFKEFRFCLSHSLI